MAKLVLSSGGSVLNNYFIDKPRIAIGSAAHNDVVIADPQVGSEHAAIITVGADQIIEGLDESRGTFVNGQKISRHILKHRDVVEFGAFSLCYLSSRTAQETEFDRTMIIAALPRQGEGAIAATLGPAGERPAPVARGADARFPSGRLRRLFGAGLPPRLELDRVVTVIGTPGVVLAVVTRRPHGYFLTHVDGHRRARLNGAAVADVPCALRNGDLIEAGDQQFEFLLDAAAAEGQPAAAVASET